MTTDEQTKLKTETETELSAGIHHLKHQQNRTKNPKNPNWGYAGIIIEVKLKSTLKKKGGREGRGKGKGKGKSKGKRKGKGKAKEGRE